MHRLVLEVVALRLQLLDLGIALNIELLLICHHFKFLQLMDNTLHVPLVPLQEVLLSSGHRLPEQCVDLLNHLVQLEEVLVVSLGYLLPPVAFF